MLNIGMKALTRSTKEPLLACTGTLDKVTFDVSQDGRGLGSLEAVSSMDVKYVSRYKKDQGPAVSIRDDHGSWRRR
ncbi:hypothetical protein B0T09DRAFT_365706 [Sordaria sp. MPI-SDFR-AT-0083]|nr:hypothetical protein B0T09DRAFT_365706 [Sordaria sp. MPI-SDFR-AT-0083]